jgi:hypothetical protein
MGAGQIREDGKRIWRGKCASDPQLLATVIRKRALDASGWCSRQALFRYGATMR